MERADPIKRIEGNPTLRYCRASSLILVGMITLAMSPSCRRDSNSNPAPQSDPATVDSPPQPDTASNDNRPQHILNLFIWNRVGILKSSVRSQLTKDGTTTQIVNFANNSDGFICDVTGVFLRRESEFDVYDMTWKCEHTVDASEEARRRPAVPLTHKIVRFDSTPLVIFEIDEYLYVLIYSGDRDHPVEADENTPRAP